MALAAPPRTLSRASLETTELPAATLVRITRHTSGEPHFGRSRAHRFDDPGRGQKLRFGVCYLGTSLVVAFAESILHDTLLRRGRLRVPIDVLRAIHVVRFEGPPLRLVDLTGASLKRLGADGALSTELPYAMPQRWSAALHRHPARVDGLLYVSRHLNTGLAVALYDRAPPLKTAQVTPFLDYPGALRAIVDFGVELV